MSLGKWLSLSVGLCAALGMGVLILCAQAVGWPREGAGLAGMFAACAATGLVAAIAQWLVLGRFEAEVRHLASHIEFLARAESRASTFEAKMGLGPVARAAESAVTTLRKRAEQLLSQRRELEVQVRISDAQRRHAEAILNSISDAVVVTDAFNEVVMVNEAAGRVLSFEADQALRRPVDQIVCDPVLVKLIKDMREGGDPSLRRHVEHRMGHNGHSAVYDVALACVSGARGNQPETAGVVAILRDITKEKEIAEMKSDFVSNVSHELRTPLSSIKAYVEMLVDGEATDEQTRSEFYNIIQGETNRLQRLIDNILNISRIESGVVKVQREHISLPTLVKEAIDVMQPQARAKNIELVDTPTPLFFQVFADKDMIYQAILNLVGNAIKYTKEGGKVTVSISVDEHSHMVNVHVTDTGVGIPPEDLPHVFDKFYRVADHKKLAKGTGLGLALVKQITETVHGGVVRVNSQVGKGSTFTFGLPLADNGY